MTITRFIISAILGILLFEAVASISQHVKTGDGKYTGILVETRHHGIFFKTYGAHFKTGENSADFEDFCTNKAMNEKLNQLPPDARVEISYKGVYMTPSWKCDIEDSNDIITNVKVI